MLVFVQDHLLSWMGKVQPFVRMIFQPFLLSLSLNSLNRQNFQLDVLQAIRPVRGAVFILSHLSADSVDFCSESFLSFSFFLRLFLFRFVISRSASRGGISNDKSQLVDKLLKSS